MPCQAGVEILMQKNGRLVLNIFRGLQVEKGIAWSLQDRKLQMVINLGIGLVLRDCRKKNCHRSAKHGWKHYPVGLGELSKVIDLFVMS